MGNSRVDKSQEFIKEGMTLITEVESDKYLRKQVKKMSKRVKSLITKKSGLDGFCGKW